MIESMYAVGFVRDGQAVIAYEVWRWVACGDGVVLIHKRGEIVLEF